MTSRRRKSGVIAATIALLLIASLILTGLILVYQPLATIDGEFRLLGLDQRAEVLRDTYGLEPMVLHGDPNNPHRIPGLAEALAKARNNSRNARRGRGATTFRSPRSARRSRESRVLADTPARAR